MNMERKSGDSNGQNRVSCTSQNNKVNSANNRGHVNKKGSEENGRLISAPRTTTRGPTDQKRSPLRPRADNSDWKKENPRNHHRNSENHPREPRLNGVVKAEGAYPVNRTGTNHISSRSITVFVSEVPKRPEDEIRRLVHTLSTGKSRSVIAVAKSLLRAVSEAQSTFNKSWITNGTPSNSTNASGLNNNNGSHEIVNNTEASLLSKIADESNKIVTYYKYKELANYLETFFSQEPPKVTRKFNDEELEDHLEIMFSNINLKLQSITKYLYFLKSSSAENLNEVKDYHKSTGIVTEISTNNELSQILSSLTQRSENVEKLISLTSSHNFIMYKLIFVITKIRNRFIRMNVFRKELDDLDIMIRLMADYCNLSRVMTILQFKNDDMITLLGKLAAKARDTGAVLEWILAVKVDDYCQTYQMSISSDSSDRSSPEENSAESEEVQNVEESSAVVEPEEVQNVEESAIVSEEVQNVEESEEVQNIEESSAVVEPEEVQNEESSAVVEPEEVQNVEESEEVQNEESSAVVVSDEVQNVEESEEVHNEEEPVVETEEVQNIEESVVAEPEEVQNIEESVVSEDVHNEEVESAVVEPEEIRNVEESVVVEPEEVHNEEEPVVVSEEVQNDEVDSEDGFELIVDDPVEASTLEVPAASVEEPQETINSSSNFPSYQINVSCSNPVFSLPLFNNFITRLAELMNTNPELFCLEQNGAETNSASFQTEEKSALDIPNVQTHSEGEEQQEVYANTGEEPAVVSEEVQNIEESEDVVSEDVQNVEESVVVEPEEVQNEEPAVVVSDEVQNEEVDSVVVSEEVQNVEESEEVQNEEVESAVVESVDQTRDVSKRSNLRLPRSANGGNKYLNSRGGKKSKAKNKAKAKRPVRAPAPPTSGQDSIVESVNTQVHPQPEEETLEAVPTESVIATEVPAESVIATEVPVESVIATEVPADITGQDVISEVAAGNASPSGDVKEGAGNRTGVDETPSTSASDPVRVTPRRDEEESSENNEVTPVSDVVQTPEVQPARQEPLSTDSVSDEGTDSSANGSSGISTGPTVSTNPPPERTATNSGSTNQQSQETRVRPRQDPSSTGPNGRPDRSIRGNQARGRGSNYTRGRGGQPRDRAGRERPQPEATPERANNRAPALNGPICLQKVFQADAVEPHLSLMFLLKLLIKENTLNELRDNPREKATVRDVLKMMDMIEQEITAMSWQLSSISESTKVLEASTRNMILRQDVDGQLGKDSKKLVCGMFYEWDSVSIRLHEVSTLSVRVNNMISANKIKSDYLLRKLDHLNNLLDCLIKDRTKCLENIAKISERIVKSRMPPNATNGSQNNADNNASEETTGQAAEPPLTPEPNDRLLELLKSCLKDQMRSTEMEQQALYNGVSSIHI